MTRILVTGGAGFIGSHLVDALVGQGHQVVVLDNLSSGKIANLKASSTALRFVEADVRDIAAHQSAIGDIDIVVHLAAMISGHDSLLQPVEYLRANVEGTQAVIDFVAAVGARRIVFASSSTVYGNQAAGPISEAQLPDPLTVYGLSKLAGEHLLRLYSPIKGFSHCSLRLFNVYGPRQATDHPYANVTCKFSHAAANGLGVTLYGDGEQSRDFIFVTDVVAALLHVIQGSRQAVYNVGTGLTFSINEMIAALSDIGGTPLQADRKPPWPNDIRSIQADISRLRDEFAFRPLVTLEAGLRRTVEYFASEPA